MIEIFGENYFFDFNDKNFLVKKVDLSNLDEWILKEDLNLEHKSKGFFTFVGIESELSKEILINQNEIGFLASIVSEDIFKNQKLYLVQRKIEPGNNPLAQIAPVIQMTHSNINGKHGKNLKVKKIIRQILDNKVYCFLQTEQSDSFLHKRNLNLLAKLTNAEKFELNNLKNTFWISTKNIIELTLSGEKINSDLRSVLFLEFAFKLISKLKLEINNNFDNDKLQKIQILHFLKQRPWNFVKVSEIAFYKNGSIFLKSENDSDKVEISGFKINANSREVNSWSQPLLIIPPKIINLIYEKSNKNIKFLLSKNCSPGTINEFELLPTSITSLSKSNCGDKFESIINTKLVHHSLQNDEGGRFWRRKNLYRIFTSDKLDEIKIVDDYLVLNLSEIIYLYKNSFTISIELRSILFVFFAHLLSE